MEINFQKPSDVLGQLSIKIAEEDYKSGFTNKLKDYAKKVNLKGFRPGKVPLGVVKNMVGDSLLAEEVFQIVDKEINSYITDNNLNIIGKPLPAEDEQKIDWKNQKEFNFVYDLGLFSDFNVSITKKLSFNHHLIKASDDKVTEVHESMLKRFGTSEQVDTVAEGNVVKGKVKKLDSDFEDDLNLWLDKLKKTQQKVFLGKSKEDVITFDIQKLFSKDEALIAQFLGISKEEAKAVSGEYEFTIASITSYVDAEVNQEFYDKVFGPGKVSNEEEYRAELNKNISQGFTPNIEYMLFKDIRTKLVEKTPIEFSDDFFKRWMLEANQDAKLEDIEKEFDKYSEELKWSLIRNHLVKENNIEATFEEVKNDAYKALVNQYLGGQQVGDEMKEAFEGFVDKYLQEENGKNYYSHYENILATKVMDVLKEKVTLKEKEVTTEEFEKLVEKSL